MLQVHRLTLSSHKCFFTLAHLLVIRLGLMYLNGFKFLRRLYSFYTYPNVNISPEGKFRKSIRYRLYDKFQLQQTM